MKHKSLVIFLIFLLINIQLFDIQSQNTTKNIIIPWQEPLVYQQNDDEKTSLLYFSGAVSSPEFETLPAYFERIPANAQYKDYEVRIFNEQYEKMTDEEMLLIPSSFQSTSIHVVAQTVIDKKRPYTTLMFIPIRKNGNSYEKLVSASISIKGRAEKGAAASKSYAANSIFQSGNWYQIATDKSGIHKVTYADLSNLGIPMNGLPSAQIAIFGNGGGMLPEANSAFRYDDVQELPLEMHDGGDGIFNDGDYFLFYANGPVSWNYDEYSQKFNHNFNIYSNLAYYFINVDAGIGAKRRIEAEDYSALTPTSTAHTYIYYGIYEVDARNIGEGGRTWLGDQYDATTSYTYTLSLPDVPITPARLTLRAAANSLRLSNFSVNVNGATIGTMNINALVSDNLAEQAERDFSFNSSTASPTITLTYSKPTSSSVGYLDYLEWQGNFNLRMRSGQIQFCNPQTVGNNAITQFNISNATSAMKVWDVTDLTTTHALAGTLAGTDFAFTVPTDTLRHFAAFSDDQCYAVQTIGSVANQNLHGTSQVDMVIVTHPDFSSQAERLANFHRENDGLSVKVVTPQQIYNEFSSGSQDVCAIRDYMRMIYDKSNGIYPSYLLLFGRPSYDFRGIEGSCPLYVPNYEANSAINEDHFRSNDDFFGLLDEGEGENCVGTIDISIGRFPVSTLAQAQIAVDKTINYSTKEILGANTQSCNFGDWKNIATFVADDEDHNTHINTADAMARAAEQNNPNINLDKIYLDAYQQVTYSSSARYPEVTAAINNRMNKGCLLFNYIGHGGKNGWATERILELTDINKWANRYNQPWMITLTCEFGWYDRALISPAELVFLNAKGGASALITTSRVAFTGSNHTYGNHIYARIFDEINGRPMTIGEINRIAKNASGGANSSLNMIYVMGDPAMRLAIPSCVVVTDSINGIAVGNFTDTLKALSHVTIAGHIEDRNGNRLDNFTGALYPSIYDKKQTQNTLQNDAASNYFEFEVQKNILFKGNVTVRNGDFSFSFILPKDINYACKPGKISYYAYSNNADATGNNHDIIIGGMGTDSISDNKGPEIELFMNDEKFVNGGTVNTSPTLLVKLKDEYGINTTGNGIGHDLVAIMDNDGQVVLNNYYEAVRDSFNCGVVRYPYEKLAIGTHKLKVRAWDILNNPSEQEIEFNVVSDEGLTIDHVLNYPNPFTTHTDFYFEHNQPGAVLDVLITIYTISGKVVKTIEGTQATDGFRSDPIPWDGRDDFGDKIGRGTYLYRLRVKAADGTQAEKIEKIVIL